MRKLIFFLGLSMLLLCASCSTEQLSKQPDRILFVGNSLTYVGNLPAVFSALGHANGHAVHSYLLVAPGATLSERIADGSAARALQKCKCNVLVLQERGGDLFGEFGHNALVQSKQAITKLAQLAHARGARALLLGTYNSPDISHKLVVMEGAAAHAAGIPYIAVSERLWMLHKDYPSLQWLREEGGHPGKALTLLDAILLYKQFYGAYPPAKEFVVHAPIYGVHTGLKPKLRRASSPPPHAGVPLMVSYSAAVMTKLLAALEKHQAANIQDPRLVFSGRALGVGRGCFSACAEGFGRSKGRSGAGSVGLSGLTGILASSRHRASSVCSAQTQTF